MIRHVVMWTMKDPAEAPRFKAALEACRGIVPGIVEFDVGLRTDGLEANCDVVLISTFVDEAALEAYLQHPQHKAMAQSSPPRAGRSVLDYVVAEPRGE